MAFWNIFTVLPSYKNLNCDTYQHHDYCLTGFLNTRNLQVILQIRKENNLNRTKATIFNPGENRRMHHWQEKDTEMGGLIFKQGRVAHWRAKGWVNAWRIKIKDYQGTEKQEPPYSIFPPISILSTNFSCLILLPWYKVKMVF